MINKMTDDAIWFLMWVQMII